MPPFEGSITTQRGSILMISRIGDTLPIPAQRPSISPHVLNTQIAGGLGRRKLLISASFSHRFA